MNIKCQLCFFDCKQTSPQAFFCDRFKRQKDEVEKIEKIKEKKIRKKKTFVLKHYKK